MDDDLKKEAYKSRRKNQKDTGKKRFMSFNVGKNNLQNEQYRNVNNSPEFMIDNQQDSIIIDDGGKNVDSDKFIYTNQRMISKTEKNTQRSLAKSQVHIIKNDMKDSSYDFDDKKIENALIQHSMNNKLDYNSVDKMLKHTIEDKTVVFKNSMNPNKDSDLKECSKESFSNKELIIKYSENHSRSKSPLRYTSDKRYRRTSTQGAKPRLFNNTSSNNLNVSNMNNITNLNNYSNLQNMSHYHGKSRLDFDGFNSILGIFVNKISRGLCKCLEQREARFYEFNKYG